MDGSCIVMFNSHSLPSSLNINNEIFQRIFRYIPQFASHNLPSDFRRCMANQAGRIVQILCIKFWNNVAFVVLPMRSCILYDSSLDNG